MSFCQHRGFFVPPVLYVVCVVREALCGWLCWLLFCCRACDLNIRDDDGDDVHKEFLYYLDRSFTEISTHHSKMAKAIFQAHIDYMIDRGNIHELMIISAENGAHWISSSDSFILREYSAAITQEDGTEKEEIVNEASNILKLMKGQPAPQGLRINGKKKEQVTRKFKDENGLMNIFTKFPQGGSCIADGGKCILIGTFDEGKGHNSAFCNETITLMAAYFAKSDWPKESVAAFTVPSGPASWQDYIQKMLIGKGNVAQALIFSMKDGAILGNSSDFTVSTLYSYTNSITCMMTRMNETCFQ